MSGKVNLMTQAEYAQHRGVSRTSVFKAIAANRISTILQDGRKMIDPTVADIQWEANTRVVLRPGDQTAPKPTPAGTPPAAKVALFDLADARAKREHHEAAMAEMRARQMASTLVERALVVQGATDASSAFAQSISRLGGLADELAVETDPDCIRRLLDTRLRQALDELADRLEEMAGGGPEDAADVGG